MLLFLTKLYIFCRSPTWEPTTKKQKVTFFPKNLGKKQFQNSLVVSGPTQQNICEYFCGPLAVPDLHGHLLIDVQRSIPDVDAADVSVESGFATTDLFLLIGVRGS